MTLAPECTFALDGAAASILVFAIPLAILATALTIFLYRKSVERAMRHSAGDWVAAALPPGEVAAINPLQISTLHPTQTETPAPMRQNGSAMRRIVAVYVLAGLVQSAVVVVLYFLLNDLAFKPVRTFIVWLPFAWPIILTLTLIATTTRKQKYSLIGGYFFVLLLLDAAMDVFALRYKPGFGELLLLWAIIMGLPTLVMALLSNRAWRPVGLIALFLGIVLAGSFLLGFQGIGCLARGVVGCGLLARDERPRRLAIEHGRDVCEIDRRARIDRLGMRAEMDPPDHLLGGSEREQLHEPFALGERHALPDGSDAEGVGGERDRIAGARGGGGLLPRLDLAGLGGRDQRDDRRRAERLRAHRVERRVGEPGFALGRGLGERVTELEATVARDDREAERPQLAVIGHGDGGREDPRQVGIGRTRVSERGGAAAGHQEVEARGHVPGA